jgi:hypothetical protein
MRTDESAADVGSAWQSWNPAGYPVCKSGRISERIHGYPNGSAYHVDIHVDILVVIKNGLLRIGMDSPKFIQNG